MSSVAELTNKENIEPSPVLKRLSTHSSSITRKPTKENESAANASANSSGQDEKINFCAPKITYVLANRARRNSGGGNTAHLQHTLSFKLNKRRKKRVQKSRAPAPPPPSSSRRVKAVPFQKLSISDSEQEETTPTSDPAFQEKTWLDKLFDYYDSTDIREGFCAESARALRNCNESSRFETDNTITYASIEEDKKLLDEEHFIDNEFDF